MLFAGVGTACMGERRNDLSIWRSRGGLVVVQGVEQGPPVFVAPARVYAVYSCPICVQ